MAPFVLGHYNFHIVTLKDNDIHTETLKAKTKQNPWIGVSTGSKATSVEIIRSWDGIKNGPKKDDIMKFKEMSGGELKDGEYIGIAFTGKTLDGKTNNILNALKNTSIVGLPMYHDHNYSLTTYLAQKWQHDPDQYGLPKKGSKSLGKVTYSTVMNDTLWIRGIFFFSIMPKTESEHLRQELRNWISDLSIGYKYFENPMYKDKTPIIDIYEVSITYSGKNKGSALAIVKCSDNSPKKNYSQATITAARSKLHTFIYPQIQTKIMSDTTGTSSTPIAGTADTQTTNTTTPAPATGQQETGTIPTSTATTGQVATPAVGNDVTSAATDVAVDPIAGDDITDDDIAMLLEIKAQRKTEQNLAQEQKTTEPKSDIPEEKTQMQIILENLTNAVQKIQTTPGQAKTDDPESVLGKRTQEEMLGDALGQIVMPSLNQQVEEMVSKRIDAFKYDEKRAQITDMDMVPAYMKRALERADKEHNIDDLKDVMEAYDINKKQKIDQAALTTEQTKVTQQQQQQQTKPDQKTIQIQAIRDRMAKLQEFEKIQKEQAQKEQQAKLATATTPAGITSLLAGKSQEEQLNILNDMSKFIEENKTNAAAKTGTMGTTGTGQAGSSTQSPASRISTGNTGQKQASITEILSGFMSMK